MPTDFVPTPQPLPPPSAGDLTRLQEPHRTGLVEAGAAFARDGNDFSLESHLGALLLTGSQSYNTATPTSDTDYFAVVVPPARRVLGLRPFDGWEPGTDAEARDTKAYSLAKFIRLAVQGNPNTLEMLFFRHHSYLYVGPAFRQILEAREHFLSRHAYTRFSSYAHGQMKKMTSGQKQGYMGRARWEEVQQLGYDAKDASRLVHLLYMAGDIARHGVVNPWCEGERQETVMAIKQGRWAISYVLELAEALKAENEAVAPDCPLPADANLRAVDELLTRVSADAIVGQTEAWRPPEAGPARPPARVLR